MDRLNRLTTFWSSEMKPKGIKMSHRILRLYAVKEVTSLSRSTIYLRIKNGEFPKPISLGGRAVGWLDSDIQKWLRERIEASKEAE